MVKRKDSVIIDTNLWISYLLSSQFKKLDSIISEKEIKILFSQELLDELIEVIQRPKFKKYFNLKDVTSLLEELRGRSVFVEVVSNMEICRDEKDDFLLALAQDGKATHLITGDNDLLVLKKYRQTLILTIEDYLQNK